MGQIVDCESQTQVLVIMTNFQNWIKKETMKKTIFYLAIFLIVFSSCNPMEEIYDEMDKNDKGFSADIEYTLQDADYSTVASLATSTNSVDAAFISSNKYFNDTVPAAAYVPAFLAKKYPALSKGSSAMVTYNYNGPVPDDLEMYLSADKYTLVEDDYSSIDGVLQATSYFSPAYAPEVYIPEVLEANIDAPAVGDLILVSYKYSTVDPQVDFENIADVVIWEESFNGSLGGFTSYNLVGAQDFTATSYGDDEFVKISGYASGNQDNENWLISGPIDLTGITDASFNFRETANYVSGHWDYLTALVSTDWDGTEPGISTATWNTLSGYTLPAGNNYVFVESGKIDFSSYANQTIYVAFRYLSGVSTAAATWEIDWAKLIKPGDKPPVIGLQPLTCKTYYEYTGNGWEKAENLYYLNSVDYDAMGSPGKYNNFSTTDRPQDYLPALLDYKYPLAGEGFSVVVVYTFYAGSTFDLADKYTVANGTWTPTYNYIEPKTSQFLYSNSGWVFDPTVSFTMKSDDYQIIVDWVKTNKGASYIDSYGTQEFYFGAGSYYSNFDLRSGKWDDSVFDTWQDAVTAGIGEALLPTKYPNAVTQVSGIDVFYIVTLATYSGSNGVYTVKFQCTKSGPNPEFTLIEGPY
jgi:hypothetical protein